MFPPNASSPFILQFFERVETFWRSRMAKSFQNIAMLQLAVILYLLSGIMCHDFALKNKEESYTFHSSSGNIFDENNFSPTVKKSLFFRNHLHKTVLTKWNQLPKDLQDHIPEDSYGMLTPQCHGFSPFLYVSDEADVWSRKPKKMWVFILLHDFGDIKVLMQNIYAEVKEVKTNEKDLYRCMYLSPSYLEQRRDGISQILSVVVKLLTAFFKMLENDSGMQYNLFFIGHSMGGIIIRLLMEQNNQFGVEEVQRYMFNHNKFNVESVVTIASPHGGVTPMYNRMLNLHKMNLMDEMAIEDEDQRLLTLAFNEFRAHSYIPQLGERVVFYAIIGDDLVNKESALGLLQSPPTRAVLSKSDPYEICRHMFGYGPHFPYVIHRPNFIYAMDSIHTKHGKTQFFMSFLTNQRFLVDLTSSRSTSLILHFLARGSEIRAAENFTLYYRHIASKVIQPLKHVHFTNCGE